MKRTQRELSRKTKRSRVDVPPCPVLPIEIWRLIWEYVDDLPTRGAIECCCKTWRDLKLLERAYLGRFDRTYFIRSVVHTIDDLHHGMFIDKDGVPWDDYASANKLNWSMQLDETILMLFDKGIFPLFEKHGAMFGSECVFRSMLNDHEQVGTLACYNLDAFTANAQSLIEDLEKLEIRHPKLIECNPMEYGRPNRSNYGYYKAKGERFDSKFVMFTIVLVDDDDDDVTANDEHKFAERSLFAIEVTQLSTTSILEYTPEMSFFGVFFDGKTFHLGRDTSLRCLVRRLGEFTPKDNRFFIKATTKKQAKKNHRELHWLLVLVMTLRKADILVTNIMQLLYDWMLFHTASFKNHRSLCRCGDFYNSMIIEYHPLPDGDGYYYTICTKGFNPLELFPKPK